MCSTGFAVLRAREQVTDPHFVFHQLFSETISAQLRALETGSNYPAVSEADVRRLLVPAPTRDEQRRVSAVLDTVDEAIAKTEAVIAKLKQVRAGLLHDLLTRGLDEHGELRDPEAHPEQFRDSPLGLVPKSWVVETSGALLTRGVLAEIQDGNHGELHPKEGDFVEDGVPFIMAADIREDRVDLKYCKRIPSSICSRLRVGHARAGDVLLSHKASIGFVALIGANHGEVMLTPQVTYYRIGAPDRLDGEFLSWVMRGEKFQRQLRSLAAQSTRDYVGITLQRGITIIFPKEAVEQQAIASRLRATQAVAESEEDELRKLRDLKSGLMDDLLTGRVCVLADLGA